MVARRLYISLLSAWALAVLPQGIQAAILPPTPIPILDYDPSVRSTAMGGAAGAVFWGADPNHWANPALLGFVEGIAYEDALEQLPDFVISGLGEDIIIRIRTTARRATIGHGGLGVALTGRPFDGPGGVRREYGLGPDFQSYDQVRSWSLGISAAKLVETFANYRHGRAPSITRYLDAAFGYAQKTVDVGAGVFDEHGVLRDWGLLARARAPLALKGMPVALEGAYSYSVLNAGGGAKDMSFIPTRHFRNSLSLHATAGRLPDSTPFLPSWFRTGLEPLVSVGSDWDLEHLSWYSERNTHTWGGEMVLASVFFLRMGRDQASRPTRGYGIALPLGGYGGMRYDRASVDGDLVRDVTFRGWRVWIDPLALTRALR